MTDPAITIRVSPHADVVRELFQLRYGAQPPEFPHHVIAFFCPAGGGELPICYVHFTAVNDMLLGGGACVDSRVLRRIPSAARAAIRSAGGAYRMTLDWAVRHFALDYPAIFGYCGDVLAERIDLSAGFERTVHRHLLVHWTRNVDVDERVRLIERAHAVGPF